MQTKDTLHLKLLGASMIIAPLLFGISTFFWQNNEYGVIASTLIVIASIFWIPAFTAMFSFLKNKMPGYYSIGLFIAIYGACLGGIGFAFLGYFTTVFHISHQTYIKTLAQYPVSSGLLIFWAGPLFPLSLLVLGINLARKKVVATWLCIMICLAGIAFPFGRALRNELIAHCTDLLLIVPFIITGFQFIKETDKVREKMAE